MYRLALLLSAVAAAIAQDTPDLFKKAPPGVDEALRARVSQFYQLHIDGKFRLAEQLVAEDTKDFFFTAGKPRYISFEINRIEYSDDFTKARAIMLTEQQILIPGAGAKVFKGVPSWSRWKLEDGKWCWYVEVKDLQTTPWGTSPVNPMANAGKPVASPPPQMPGVADMQAMLSGVRADKSKIVLKQVGDEAEVTISNGIPGAVNLQVPPNPLGLTVSIDKPALTKGQTAVMKFKRTAKSQQGTVYVTVEPTNQEVAILVLFE